MKERVEADVLSNGERLPKESEDKNFWATHDDTFSFIDTPWKFPFFANQFSIRKVMKFYGIEYAEAEKVAKECEAFDRELGGDLGGKNGFNPGRSRRTARKGVDVAF